MNTCVWTYQGVENVISFLSPDIILFQRCEMVCKGWQGLFVVIGGAEYPQNE